MTYLSIQFLAVALVGCLLAAGVCRAATREYVLEDLLNKQWTREPLSYALEAEQGTCDPASVRLRGPEGPVGCQLSDVVLWPGTQSLKSANLWFVTDLAPLARKIFTGEYGPKPPAEAGATTDLHVTVTPQGTESVNDQFGVRLMRGEQRYAEPVPASQVPGPVLGMRLAEGTWFGGSDLYGEMKVSGYSATLTAQGPVFAEVTYHYTYADGNSLQLAVRLGIGDCARELHVARCDPGAWVKLVGQNGWHELLPVMKSAEGDVCVDLNLAAGAVGGVRKFAIGESAPTEAVGLRPLRDG